MEQGEVNAKQIQCMVEAKQCKARKITKVRANKSKAKQGKCKSRQSREDGAEQRQSLQDLLKKVK